MNKFLGCLMICCFHFAGSAALADEAVYCVAGKYSRLSNNNVAPTLIPEDAGDLVLAQSPGVQVKLDSIIPKEDYSVPKFMSKQSYLLWIKINVGGTVMSLSGEISKDSMPLKWSMEEQDLRVSCFVDKKDK